MKVPKQIRSYCPRCNKHTIHEVSLAKKGKESSLSRGRRKYEEVKKGYGGSPRTPKKPVYKTGKRVVLLLKCKECNKSHHRTFPFRVKRRLEIVS